MADLEVKNTSPQGYTIVYFCPMENRIDVASQTSGTTHTLGGAPVGRIKGIACRYEITEPHKDFTAIVRIPLMSIADGSYKAEARTLAEQLFHPQSGQEPPRQ